MVVVDDGVVAHIVQCLSHAVHIHVTGVGNDFLVPLLFWDLPAHVAEMDVEDFALFTKVANPLKDIFARFVTGAYAEGHTVVRGGDLGKEAVEGGEVVENLWYTVEAGNGWIVAVHGNFDTSTLRHRYNAAEDLYGALPDLLVGGGTFWWRLVEGFAQVYFYVTISASVLQ